MGPCFAENAKQASLVCRIGCITPAQGDCPSCSSDWLLGARRVGGLTCRKVTCPDQNLRLCAMILCEVETSVGRADRALLQQHHVSQELAKVHGERSSE